MAALAALGPLCQPDMKAINNKVQDQARDRGEVARSDVKSGAVSLDGLSRPLIQWLTFLTDNFYIVVFSLVTEVRTSDLLALLLLLLLLSLSDLSAPGVLSM